jgi:hypothetical protein
MSFVSGHEFTHAATSPPIFRKIKYAAKLRVLYQGLASAKPHPARPFFEKLSPRRSCAQFACKPDAATVNELCIRARIHSRRNRLTHFSKNQVRGKAAPIPYHPARAAGTRR